MGDAGVVDQHVDAAEALAHRVHAPRTVGFVADVAGECGAVDALRLPARSATALRFRAVDVEQRQLAPAAAKRRLKAAAETAAGAGDDDDLTAEVTPGAPSACVLQEASNTSRVVLRGM